MFIDFIPLSILLSIGTEQPDPAGNRDAGQHLQPRHHPAQQPATQPGHGQPTGCIRYYTLYSIYCTSSVSDLAHIQTYSERIPNGFIIFTLSCMFYSVFRIILCIDPNYSAGFRFELISPTQIR